MNRVAVAAVTASVMLGVGGDALADSTRVVDGTVYVDNDGSGTLSDADDTVSGAVVAWETTVFTRADSSGRFTMTVPDEPGLVWVRPTDAYRPGAAWTPVWDEGDATADVALRYADADTAHPLTFVVAADTHAGIEHMDDEHVTTALRQATAVWPPPAFFVVVGDMTQTNAPEEFALIGRAIADLSTPYVAVPGNHDWYDAGDSYRQAFGPASYSFETGGVHFIVLNDAEPVDARLEFVTRDLSFADGDPLVAVFTHAPPGEALVSALSGVGVSYLYTGHQHANRVFDHGELVELNTQPLAMGGIDQTPAGFRVIALAADERSLESHHRTIVDAPIVEIVYPRPNDTARPCDTEVIAAVEPGSTVEGVWLTLPGESAVEMRRAGGWAYRHRATTLCEPGVHEAVLSVMRHDEPTLTRVARIRVGEVPAPTGAPGEWPMFHGDAAHSGRSDTRVVPPLETLWARTVGGHIQGGSPVVAGDRLFVPVVDYGSGNDGGIVAFDMATGDISWRYAAAGGVRNAPAVAHGVVVAARVDGTVVGLDAATGIERWEYALARRAQRVERNIYSAPTIRGTVAFVGIQRELVALDVRTGARLWTTEPHWAGGDTSSYSSPALSDRVLVTSFSRGLYGLHGYDPDSGALLWRTAEDVSQHVNASPVIAGDTAFVTNELGTLFAVDLRDGATRWHTDLSDSPFTWSFAVVGTSAVSERTLYVPAANGLLHAVDAATGEKKWTAATGNGLVRAAHYRGNAPQLAASPVVTGPIVWIGGADGVLRALLAETGREVWSHDLGVPILSAPVPAGAYLVVTSYDGTVRLMRSADELTLQPRDPAGLAAASPRERDALGTALLVGFVALRLRRRRS
jgi:outer membrane protein assembly factor BamB/predicted phosphodiesterase